MTYRFLRPIALFAAAAMIVAACSGGVGESSPTTNAPSSSDTTPALPVSDSPATSAATAATTQTTQPAANEPDEATERWAAIVVEYVVGAEGAHEVTIGLSTQSENSDVFVTPYVVEVTLFDQWAGCEIAADSWNAEVSPAVHPLDGAREWEFRPLGTDVTENGDGSGTVRAELLVISGDDSAALVLTGTISAGCNDAGASDSGSQDESDDPGDDISTDGPDSASDQSETTGESNEESADDSETGSEDAEADQPTTTEPEASNAQLRRWDHQALIALPLWEHCPPEAEPADLRSMLDRFDRTWAGWDSETVTLDGHAIAAGWWTDRQIGMWLPGSGITAASAREHAEYHVSADSVSLWPEDDAPTAHSQATPRTLPTLRAAMEHRGHRLDSFTSMLRATKDGIAGSGAWPDDIHIGLLLNAWTMWRYAQPPTTREPVVWALRSLFGARESTCAGDALVGMCSSDNAPPSLLRGSHPIGRVLRSLACGE